MNTFTPAETILLCCGLVGGIGMFFSIMFLDKGLMVASGVFLLLGLVGMMK